MKKATALRLAAAGLAACCLQGCCLQGCGPQETASSAVTASSAAAAGPNTTASVRESSPASTTAAAESTTAATTAAPGPNSLSAQQIEELEAFLNDKANNGFVGRDSYGKPEELNLRRVLYDGAGFGQWILDLSEEEQADILRALGMVTLYCSGYKFTRAAVDAYLQEKIGMPLAGISPIGVIPDCQYLEKYDAYYLLHGDTEYCLIEITGGETEDDGTIVVRYTGAGNGTLRLRKTDGGYRFLSDINDNSQAS